MRKLPHVTRKPATMYRQLHKLKRRSLLWFSPLVALPLLWWQFTPHPQQTPPQTQEDYAASPTTFFQLQSKLEQSSSSVAPNTPHSPTLAPQKRQRSPQKRTATKNNPKAKLHPYTAPAIEIRVAIAQNVNRLAIASSTSTNILDANGKLIERIPPGQAFQARASNSTIIFTNWQTPSPLWTPAD